MHVLQSAAPSVALREVVRAYAQRTTGAHDAELVQPVLASLEQILEFEFGTPPTVDYQNGKSEPAHQVALVGAHSSPSAMLRLRTDVESFAIFLQPVALQLLLGLPGHYLADSSYPAEDVLGIRVKALWSVLAGARTFEDRVRLAEDFLLRMPQVAEPTRIASVAMVAFRSQGRIHVDEMAARASLSVRQFERQFEHEIGMPPKLFARISRFQCAVDAKIVTPTHTWLDVAHSSGYYDQMHMVRDFKSLGGLSPTHLMAQLGDTRPPALAHSNWSEIKTPHCATGQGGTGPHGRVPAMFSFTDPDGNGLPTKR